MLIKEQQAKAEESDSAIATLVVMLLSLCCLFKF